MKVSFCLSLISNAYVRILCRKIPQFSPYLSVESIIYASFVLTKKERKGKDDEFSCETDDEDICILVCFL